MLTSLIPEVLGENNGEDSEALVGRIVGLGFAGVAGVEERRDARVVLARLFRSDRATNQHIGYSTRRSIARELASVSKRLFAFPKTTETAKMARLRKLIDEAKHVQLQQRQLDEGASMAESTEGADQHTSMLDHAIARLEIACERWT